MSDGEDDQAATTETETEAARRRPFGPGAAQKKGGDKVIRDRMIRVSTLWQPWATLVARGHKTIETRTSGRLWKNMVGRTLAIHAGLSRDDDAWRGILQWENRYGLLVKDCMHLWPRGAILAVCRVGDVWRCSGADPKWADEPMGYREASHNALIDARQRYCIELADVHEFDEPIPIRGHQGIWHWEIPPVRAAEVVAAGLHVGL